jgi:RNA recognition motif-containing protein
MSTATEGGKLNPEHTLGTEINIFAFRVVDFESPDDVANAIRKLDGIELKGKRVKLSEDAVRHHPKVQ